MFFFFLQKWIFLNLKEQITLFRSPGALTVN